jgi:hypothetical protein
MPEVATESPAVVIRYRDAHGHLQEIRVTAAQRRAIRAIREKARREHQRWKRKHRTFTDIKLNPASIRNADLPGHDLGSPWEGPRYHFSWLVGESRTWAGPESLVAFDLDPDGRCANIRCAICQGQDLPSGAYCLACDRSGWDMSIPTPGDVPIITAVQQGDLKGGLEGKR